MEMAKWRNQDVKTRVYDAMEKARRTQSQLNAVVTFIDVEEQLKRLETMDPKLPLYGIPVVLNRNPQTASWQDPASQCAAEDSD